MGDGTQMLSIFYSVWVYEYTYVVPMHLSRSSSIVVTTDIFFCIILIWRHSLDQLSKLIWKLL